MKDKKVKIIFPLKNSEKIIKVWTKRPELFFGVTFLKIPKNYLKETENLFAFNPVNSQKIPVFIWENISEPQMGIPAHIQEDYDFAKKNNLEIKQVIDVKLKNRDNRPGSFAIIKTKDKKFIFQERADNIKRYPGKISMFAGGIEQKESPLQCIIREVFEELELNVVDNSTSIHLIEYIKPHNEKKLGKPIFLINGVDEKKLVLHEGKSIIKDSLEEIIKNPKLLPSHKKYIKENIKTLEKKVFTENGVLVNSEKFDGMDSLEARNEIVKFLEQREKYRKKLEKWHQLKLFVHLFKKNKLFKEQEIWWAHVGQNIGFEENGKNNNFSRPVLVLKKYNQDMAFVLPMTSKDKENNFFYFPLKHNQKISYVILSQGKNISSKRLIRRIWKLNDNTFTKIKNKFKKIL